MPRRPNVLAITTRDSIANLWLMAEKAEEVSILVPSREACHAIRNKLYAHRTRLRKAALSHTGVEASHLDHFTFTFHPEPGTTKWRFTITTQDLIEFELIIPDDWEGDLPFFDMPAINERYDDTTGQWTTGSAEPGHPLETEEDQIPF